MSAPFRFFGFISCLLLSGAMLTFGQTTGDFNGDGKLDIVQLGQCSPEPCTDSTITVLLGQGNGQFRPLVTSITTSFPVGAGLVVADFNGDHKLDIAFSIFRQEGGTGIAVAMGNGDGTFGGTIEYAEPFAAAFYVGDVNGDNKPDLVLPAVNISVLLNNGDGTFRALADAPGAFAECALADANHDGKLDLIGASIQLGNGDGTFQPAQTISGPGNCPVVADFNGDGNVDVISSTSTGLDLYLGNGDGTFRSPIHRWLFPGEARLKIGDFNGDGKPDLIADLYPQADILLNMGNGTFRPAVGYLCPFEILGDFNNDGRTDVAGFKPPWVAALASADGTLPLPRSFRLPGGRSAGYLAVTDWNGDAKTDLTVINHQSDGWDSGEVAGLLGKGDGTFTAQKALVPTGTGSIVIGMADLNNDGKLDVVVGGRSLNVLLGLGNGLFQPPQSYPVRNARGTIADVNGDGIPDLVLVFGSFFRPQGIVMLGNGDGTFRNGSTLPGSFDQVLAGDFNHDGKQDLAGTVSGAGGVEGQVGILLGNGDGTFQPISSVRKGQVGRLMAGDFNNDGILDVVGVGTTASFAATASVYLGTGTGTLQPPKNVWVKGGASYPGGTAIADFNKDGKLDLAVSLSLNKTVILFGNGAGGFGSRTEYFGGGGAIVAGDFNQDGVQDLAVMIDGRTVAILLRGK